MILEEPPIYNAFMSFRSRTKEIKRVKWHLFALYTSVVGTKRAKNIIPACQRQMLFSFGVTLQCREYINTAAILLLLLSLLKCVVFGDAITSSADYLPLSVICKCFTISICLLFYFCWSRQQLLEKLTEAVFYSSRSGRTLVIWKKGVVL